MEQDNEGRDWGNVKFRAQRERGVQAHSADDAQSRFVTGLVVFLAVAIAYPWYSYWVQSRLLAYEVTTGLQQVSDEFAAASAKRQQESARVEQAHRETATRERIAAVRVMGASESTTGPVVVVNLGQAGVGESTTQICQQAHFFLGRALHGERLRLQRYRGSQPTTDAGTVYC